MLGGLTSTPTVADPASVPSAPQAWSDFGRWVLAAAVYTAVFTFAWVTVLPQRFLFLILAIPMGLMEGYFLFQNFQNRLLWTIAVVGTVWTLFPDNILFEVSPLVTYVVLFASAAIECLTAGKERRLSWVWLVVTPLLFGFTDAWFPWVQSAITTLGKPGFVAGRTLVVSGMASILLIRAVVGTLVTRRLDQQRAA